MNNTYFERRMVIEDQFNLENISKEIEISKKLIRRILSNKIDILKEIVDSQTRLNGIYSQQCQIKQYMGLNYDNNVVLNNTLSNQTYQSLSIILLSENTLCGSARVLLRQFFEALLIAKYSDYDSSLIEVWKSKTEEKDFKTEISLSKHVLRKIEEKGKDISGLRKTWNQLNNFTHPTRYAQQLIRIPLVKSNANKKEMKENFTKWIYGSNLIPDTHLTLDLLFMLLCMNYHLLIGHLGRKAYRCDFGYPKDSFKSFINEKALKEKTKRLFKKYFEINKEYKGVNKILKRNIFEYKLSWR